MKVAVQEEQRVNPGMLEKYYHCRGAAACEEGNFKQAVRFFRKALALDDQAYTRSHLSLAYEGKRDHKRALMEITRAIDLSPLNPEYYLRRSAMWRRGGDDERADADYATAVRLDASCAQTEEIREALTAIERAFAYTQRDEWLRNIVVRDGQLEALIAERTDFRNGQRQAVENRSCLVACPAFCCHFSKEAFLHGVLISPWKLRAIREYLTAKGLDEEEYVEKLTINDRELRLRLIPPDLVMVEKGQGVVYFPKHTEACIGPNLARNLPVGKGYSQVGWFTESARACAFLTDHRCMIHDLGDEPALSACKEFLCLTGFVSLVLAHLGVATAKEIGALNVAESNRLAVEAAVLLGQRIYNNKAVVGLEEDLYETLKHAIEADAKEDIVKRDRFVRRYREIEGRYSTLYSRQTKLLRRDGRRLIAGQSPVRSDSGISRTTTGSESSAHR
jgi:tetratricopeptide (TPR) repeat protein